MPSRRNPELVNSDPKLELIVCCFQPLIQMA